MAMTSTSSQVSRYARILCLCGHLKLEGLGVELRQGETARVPESLARSSPELERYRRLNAVEVTYIERVAMSNRPMPMPSRSPRQPQFPRQKRIQPSPPPVPSEVPANVQQELVSLRKEVRDLRQLCEGMDMVLQTMQAAMMARPDAETLAATVGAAVAATMRQMGGVPVQVATVQAAAPAAPQSSRTTPSASLWVEEEEEPFIPSGLVNKDTEVSVQSTESKDEDASSAAAGLRQFRSKREET